MRSAVAKVAVGQVFPEYFGLPCKYHSTNAPYLFPSTFGPYQKDKRSKPEDLPKWNVLSEIGVHWTEKHFHFLFSRDRRRNMQSGG